MLKAYDMLTLGYLHVRFLPHQREPLPYLSCITKRAVIFYGETKTKSVDPTHGNQRKGRREPWKLGFCGLLTPPHT